MGDIIVKVFERKRRGDYERVRRIARMPLSQAMGAIEEVRYIRERANKPAEYFVEFDLVGCS